MVVTHMDLVCAVGYVVENELSDGPGGPNQREMNYLRNFGSDDACNVLNFFRNNNQAIDNDLSSTEREIFYYLEDLDIVESEREETYLPLKDGGSRWRLFYWFLKEEQIDEYCRMSKNKEVGYVDEGEEMIYTEDVLEKLYDKRAAGGL